MTKIALVTGATAGFGNAICRTLLKAGYLVIGTGRRQERLAQLEQAQTLAQETGASHAAAFFSLDGKLLAIREDVGRHVALDKLIGWYEKVERPVGFVFVTSRASFEMVQKCLAVGIEMLCAISATTEMAVNLAKENQFTLLAFARKGRATIYAGEHRLAI